MRTIWKYPLKITTVQVVTMPDGAEILSAQMQGAELCLWASVFPKRALVSRVSRTICIFGTGHDMPTDYDYLHIDTVQQAGGSLVWHVFERI